MNRTQDSPPLPVPAAPAALLVLVADDDAPSRALLCSYLSYLGLDGCEARDGHEAVVVACQRLPGLILMDLHMPCMNGLEAVRMLKGMSATRDIPIVAVSSDGDNKKLKRSAIHAGCTECFSKPLRFDEFRELVGRYRRPVAQDE